MHIFLAWTLSRTFSLFPLVWVIGLFSKFVLHPAVAWFCTNWKGTEQSAGAYRMVLLSAHSLGDSACSCSHVQRFGWVYGFGLVDFGGGFGCRWQITGPSSWHSGWVEIVSSWTCSFANWISKWSVETCTQLKLWAQKPEGAWQSLGKVTEIIFETNSNTNAEQVELLLQVGQPHPGCHFDSGRCQKSVGGKGKKPRIVKNSSVNRLWTTTALADMLVFLLASPEPEARTAAVCSRPAAASLLTTAVSLFYKSRQKNTCNTHSAV